MPSTIQCNATLQTSLTGEPQCVDGTGAAVSWTAVPDFDLSQLDTSTMAQGFAAGFTMIGIAWAIGKGVALVLKQISR